MKKHNLSKLAAPLLLALTLTIGLSAQSPLLKPDKTPIHPQIPHENRQDPGRIFLERADSLIVREDEPDVTVVVGNVQFRQGGMYMFCDSARFYTDPSLPADSMEAFGNIKMVQGDTLFLYGDELNYGGFNQLATVYGIDRDVRLINRDVTLTAPVVNYSLVMELGYYDTGGKLTDRKNTLTSVEGEYIPSTKDANFYDDVRLLGISDKGDVVHIRTDTLLYNTSTRIAELPTRSLIYGRDGEIYTDEGIFNTRTNVATLLDRSMVHGRRGNTLTGDRLVYNRAIGQGEAFGNVVLTDSARQMTVEGDYGFYNEITDSAYVTGNARAMEYSRPDTLYFHGEAIRTYDTPDSVRLIVANPHVRFWRVDVQGVCDSMTIVQSDSTIRMNYDPILWSEQRQVSGNVIQVFMNDSTVERAWLPDFGLLAEHVEDELYNQLSGHEMMAYFDDGELRQLDVNGSVEAILVPEESDSTINKLANIESSFLKATFDKRELQKATMWNETNGTVTPLYLIKRSQLYLPKFKWEDALRPRDQWDIFRGH